MKQIRALLDNDWIELCFGPWGSAIVLAAKPHQEHIENIEDFIWRMCVSYRKLNSVTKPFQYPIPRCDDAISIMVVGAIVYGSSQLMLDKDITKLQFGKSIEKSSHFLHQIIKSTPSR